MPKVTFKLFSQRNKPIPDRVNVFILEGHKHGIIRDERDLLPASKKFTVDAPPDQYTLQLEIKGFDLFRQIVTVNLGPPVAVPLALTHKCVDLPEFAELHPAQQTLLATVAPGADPAQIWQELSDNQCATFFQLSHALLKTELANQRSLISYVSDVRRLGGAEIEDDIPDGKVRRTVGWRMHVVIRTEDRPQIEGDLPAEGTFGDRERRANPVHSKFGLVRSHREKGPLPRLQIVLNDTNSIADVDLDVEFDRSSPHDVYPHFREKFPEVTGIYRF